MSNDGSGARDLELLVNDLPAGSHDDSLDLGLLWGELTSGATRLCSTFYTHQHCYAKMVPGEVCGSSRAVSPRAVSLVERVLLGEAPKVVAADSGISVSLLTSVAQSCFKDMGVECSLRNVHLLFIMAVHACHGLCGVPRAAVHCSERERGYRIISLPRPDFALKDLLSDSEYAVTRLHNEGKSGAQIAAIRETSVRTIANQLSASYRKLRVSGRVELICHSLRVAGPRS
jgi:DNA-binding CsgD family transcriptional regulator